MVNTKSQTPWNKGKKNIYSKDTKEKMRMAKLGRKFSVEHKKKIGEAGVGRIVTEETRKKIRESNLGLKRSEETRKKLSDGRRKGENSPRWIKDRTKLKITEKRRSTASLEWKKLILKRDNYKCQLKSCECNGRLEVHHIFGWTDYPALRYIISNGITLCHFHHPLKWEEERRMITIFQEILWNQNNH